MRYAIGNWVREDIGTIDEKSLVFKDGKLSEATRAVIAGTDRVALFFWPDVRRMFSGKQAEVFEDKYGKYTREMFERDPARYGMAYYRQPFARGCYVFE